MKGCVGIAAAMGGKGKGRDIDRPCRDPSLRCGADRSGYRLAIPAVVPQSWGDIVEHGGLAQVIGRQSLGRATPIRQAAGYFRCQHEVIDRDTPHPPRLPAATARCQPSQGRRDRALALTGAAGVSPRPAAISSARCSSLFAGRHGHSPVALQSICAPAFLCSNPKRLTTS